MAYLVEIEDKKRKIKTVAAFREKENADRYMDIMRRYKIRVNKITVLPLISDLDTTMYVEGIYKPKTDEIFVGTLTPILGEISVKYNRVGDFEVGMTKIDDDKYKFVFAIGVEDIKIVGLHTAIRSIIDIKPKERGSAVLALGTYNAKDDRVIIEMAKYTNTIEPNTIEYTYNDIWAFTIRLSECMYRCNEKFDAIRREVQLLIDREEE